MTTQNLVKRGGAGEIETFAMANCLMLLSSQSSTGVSSSDDANRMFSCKTCGRKFSSFQALGGHRASHKKVKPMTSGESKTSSPAKPKTHACSICGVEFPIGQALGGHMRRHRPLGSNLFTSENSSENSENSDVSDGEKKRKIEDVVVPILKKSSSCKRVCLDLDLSLSLWKDDHHDDRGRNEGEVVEEEKDFLKLELRQPTMNWSVAY